MIPQTMYIEQQNHLGMTSVGKGVHEKFSQQHIFLSQGPCMHGNLCCHLYSVRDTRNTTETYQFS